MYTHSLQSCHESAPPSRHPRTRSTAKPLHSQELLRRRLHQRGFEATQATISRDIKELGLVKRAGDGAYQRPGADATNPETALDRARARRRRVPAPRRARPAAGRRPHRRAARRSRWPWRSIARSCRRRSARSPATTRFWSSRAARAAPPRSSSGSKDYAARMTSRMERIVLAYSGGLETSVAIPWLAERHGAEIIAVTLDLGRAACSRRSATARSPPARCARTCSTSATSSPATTSSAR